MSYNSESHHWDGNLQSIPAVQGWALRSRMEHDDPRQISISRDGQNLRLTHGQQTTTIEPGQDVHYDKEAGFSAAPAELGSDVPRDHARTPAERQMLANVRASYSPTSLTSPVKLDASLSSPFSQNPALDAAISRHPACRGRGPSGH